MILDENKEKLDKIFKKYNLLLDEKDEIYSVIESIFLHDEFQKRMTSEFPHHGEITLGEHILEDTIVTYLLSKKHRNEPTFEMEIALRIAMMHDLYELPWQNNPAADTKHFFNKHGFRHPIEAVINGNAWYPEIFEAKDDAEKIIDGVVHHMYPLPVTSFKDSLDNPLELKNFERVNLLDSTNKEILTNSSNRGKVGPVSLATSKYKEGRIMSNADKIVSMSNFKGANINDLTALLTGNNKNLEDQGRSK